jgi:hypothetical protein
MPNDFKGEVFFSSSNFPKTIFFLDKDSHWQSPRIAERVNVGDLRYSRFIYGHLAYPRDDSRTFGGGRTLGEVFTRSLPENCTTEHNELLEVTKIYMISDPQSLTVDVLLLFTYARKNKVTPLEKLPPEK